MIRNRCERIWPQRCRRGRGKRVVVFGSGSEKDGLIVEDTARLAADTLLYTADGLTIRIEGKMTLDQARAIAKELN